MSNQNNQRTYVGNGREIETKYGSMLKLSFSADDLKKLEDNLERGWVNAVVKERRTPSETGVTHYLEVDHWKPEEGAKQQVAKETAPDVVQITGDDEDDLPF